MKLKKIKCTSCGANLYLYEGRRAYVCDYCHTPFYLEDEDEGEDYKLPADMTESEFEEWKVEFTDRTQRFADMASGRYGVGEPLTPDKVREMWDDLSGIQEPVVVEEPKPGLVWRIGYPVAFFLACYVLLALILTALNGSLDPGRVYWAAAVAAVATAIQVWRRRK